MPMTLKQAFDQTARDDYGRFERATHVKVTGLKIGTSRTTGFVRFVAKTQTPEKRMMGYVWAKYATSIDFVDSKHVRLSCTCPDFVFSGAEYRLSKKGAADILYGNGEAPISSSRIYCCKHIVQVTNLLVQKGYLDSLFQLARSVKKGPK